jgi:ABC-2 type transport system permease protein
MKTFRAALAVLCIAVIALSAVLLVQKAAGRASVDLTQDRLYTLSQGTRNILARLNQPIKLKLYYSRTAAMNAPEEIRVYNNYFLYVRDLLREYEKKSHGMLTLFVIDPLPYSDQEEDAIREGVQKFPLNEGENFYFGATATTGLGKEKVIPFFSLQRQQFAEYDISRMVATVIQRDKKKVGVLSSLPVMGANMDPYMMQMMQAQGRTPPAPWTVITQLKEEYDVVPVQTDADSIGKDIDYLMVIQPKDLPDKTLYAIDQYVMGGGSLIVFEDPYCLNDRSGQDPQDPYGSSQNTGASDLNRLLKGWGVEMEPGVIACDRKLALSAGVVPGAPPSPVLPFLGLTANEVTRSEAVVGDLHDLRMLFAGVLKAVPAAGTDVVPLLQTTKAGNTWKPQDAFALRMFDPQTVEHEVADGTQPLMLACRITGKFKTNFPDGPPAEPKKPDVTQPAQADKAADAKPADDKSTDPTSADPKSAEPESAETKPAQAAPAEIKETTRPGTVLVFADVDMISDMLAYQQTFFGSAQVGDNASVVLNAVEYLGGGSDLISVRSRGGFQRPFVVVDQIEAAVDKATAAQVDALTAKIDDYQQKLDSLGAAAPGQDEKLVHSAVLAQRDKLQDDIRQARTELRRLNAGKREQIAALKARLETDDIVWAPLVVLMIAVILAARRHALALRAAARRTQQ